MTTFKHFLSLTGRDVTLLQSMEIKRYIIILLMTLGIVTGIKAQDAIEGKMEKKVVETITDSYKNWNKASWNGRLSADMLPVSATLKVYMERGKLTLISVRAPFIGEVARIEADKERILIVNKLKKRYYEREIAEISQIAPDLLEDMQALLLGRMFVVGKGQLDDRKVEDINLFPTNEEGCYMVVPTVPDWLPQVLYGFATDQESRMATFVCAYGRADAAATDEAIDPDYQYEPKFQVQTEISYRDKGIATASIQALLSGKEYTGTLTVDPIEWGGKGFDRINTDGLAKVSLRDVLRFN